MKSILHIAFDYPDAFNRKRTRAVKDLVENTQDFNHYVFTFNRSLKAKTITSHEENVYAYRIFGLPRSLLLTRFLQKCAQETIGTIEREHLDFDLIHAHKLTFEGFIANIICEKYIKKLIITLRSTDVRLLAVRKDLIKMYSRVLDRAEKIILISPSMGNNIQDIFGEELFNRINSKFITIPNVIDKDLKSAVYSNECNDRFVTVTMLSKRYIKRKNLYTILKAVQYLKKNGDAVYLDIIGSGNGQSKLEKRIKQMGIHDNINFVGYVENREMINRLSHYLGFVLCSQYETFGFVYLEAMLAGLPVICAKNSAIDGFFHSKFFSSVVYNDHVSLAKKMLFNRHHNVELKQELMTFIDSGGLQTFSKENVIQSYSTLVNQLISERG